MNDTSPDMQALHHRLLMERSNEERFLMGVSMCQTARAIVRASLDEGLSETEVRLQFLLRYYGDELDPATCAAVAAHPSTATTQAA